MIRIAVSLGLKYYKEIIASVALLFGVLFIFFISPPPHGIPEELLSPFVQQYEPLVRKYAKEQGIESHVTILLAIMEQESGGRGGDVMQSSESQGHPPEYFKDPETSIRYGVLHFKSALTRAKGDLPLALQAYNFGTHFIDYVMQRGGKYTVSLAQEFASNRARDLGWGSYGDVKYVEHVMRYCPTTAAANRYGFSKPIDFIQITSGFGHRFDPFDGSSCFHKGIDFGCQGKSVPVYAVKSGVVTRSGWQNPGNSRAGYGQRVYIDHGNSQTTVYAHLSIIGVREGQRIRQGQQIGMSGTTGSSTGIHLHLELHVNGTPVDPTLYILGKVG